MIGRTLSHYRILSEISRGGMGIVYRALDTTLGREVAVKVLPPDLVGDAERKRRFLAEARAAAALTHPHIAVVHEIGDADGVSFIAMELIEGEKLSELLARERPSVARVLKFAADVASGLRRAHERGIVHRDLKPANVMIAADGNAKLIDFGLAKLAEPRGSGESIAETVTREGMTHPGTVMGTFSYMSPEQARGQAADSRSDVFSFGIVLYEMLTGELPFQGESGADRIGSLLRDPPRALPRLSISEAVQSQLQGVLDRCLAKSPGDRFGSAGELSVRLGAIQEQVRSAPSDRRVSLGTLWVASAVVLTALVGAYFVSRFGGSRDAIRFANPVQLTSALGVEDYPTWSPDGRALAYAASEDGDAFSGNWDIWVVGSGGGSPVNRTVDHAGVDKFPSWSPDGNLIAFWSDREGGAYYVMSSLGGVPRKVPGSDAPMGWATPCWLANGGELAMPIFVLRGSDFLHVVRLDGEELRRLEVVTKRNVLDLSCSLDGELATYVDAAAPTSEVNQLWTLRFDGARHVPVGDGRYRFWSPSWSDDARYLYYVSNRAGAMDLWRQPMTNEGEPRGEPQVLTAGLGIRHAAFSINHQKLAYSQGRLVANVWRVPYLKARPATWDDAEQLTRENAFIESIDISPDRKWLLIGSDRSGNMDLWTMPSQGGELVQLTTEPTPDWGGVWSPNGEEIVFYSFRTGMRQIWVMPASGGRGRQLTDGPEEALFPSWSPDGKEIVFDRGVLWRMPVGGGEASLIAGLPPGDPNHPMWSPDGNWLAYRNNNDAGQFHVWLTSVEGETKRVTDREGDYLRWSLDGTELVFFGEAEDGWEIFAAPMDGSPIRQLTDLRGRRGDVGDWGLAVDEDYVYFTWKEDTGDLWIMDVVRE